jgi:hypothetical protein
MRFYVVCVGDDVMNDKYKRALRVACELLNGGVLYGVDADVIFAEIMERDGCVSAEDFERYILDNLEYLTKGGRA